MSSCKKNDSSLVLLSVTDKTGIVEFGRGLEQQGYELVSTGGTAAALRSAGLTVRDVSELTGFPEGMRGRIKTLHPRVFGGILARPDEEDQAFLDEHGLERFKMVVVNLYQFGKAIANPNVLFADAIEQIDIGGPSMMRAAGKNWDTCPGIVDPNDYDLILAEMWANGGKLSLQTMRRLQVKVFRTTAEYDVTISRWLEDKYEEEFAAAA